MKKYEFTGETKFYCGISRIADGELGGWLESEANLSQEGDAWVYGNAQVYGNARVSGNARVYGDDCIVQVGMQFSLTALRHGIQIGCEFRSYSDWMSMTKKQAVELGLDPKNFLVFKAQVKVLQKYFAGLDAPAKS